MPFASGEQVGPYQITEQLGAGGMATVYKAYQPQLDRYVAIKVLHTVLKEYDASFRERFDREAKIVAKLEHPNIVPIHDFAYHKDDPYLVMRYIEGQTLKARMDAGALSREEMAKIALSVSSALAHAHRNDVLHRDVKPSNILIDREGKVYLADFGLARIASTGESTLSQDMMLGTPTYISPEQAQGNRDLSGRTDIYSLGVVLYEMTVGRVPYIADTPYAIIHNHIYAPLPMPRQLNPRVPPMVERVLLKALAKNPADRFENADQLGAAFVQALRNATTDSLRPSTPASAPASPSPIRQLPRQESAPTPPAMPTPLNSPRSPQAAIPSPSPNQPLPSTQPQMAAVKRQAGRGTNVLLAALAVAALIVVGMLAVALTRRGPERWELTGTASAGSTRRVGTPIAVNLAITLPPTWTPPPPSPTGFVPTRAPDATRPALSTRAVPTINRPPSGPGLIRTKASNVLDASRMRLLEPEFLSRATGPEMRSIIAAAPDDPIGHYALAIIAYRTGDTTLGDSEVKRALELSGNDTDLLKTVADTLKAFNRRNDPLLTRLYVILESQLYVLLPKNNATKGVIGAALYAAAVDRNIKSATSDNLEAAAKFTNDGSGYALWALAEQTRGQANVAQTALDKAEKLAADSPEVLLVRGIIAMQEKDKPAAKDALSRAAKGGLAWVTRVANDLLKGLA